MNNGIINSEDSSQSYKNITIKDKIKTLEDTVNEIENDYDENVRLGIILRSEMYKLDNRTQESINDIITTTSCELSNFSEELKRLKKNDKSELNLLKQEIGLLLNEKMKIKLGIISINTRLSQMEIDIGNDLIL
jgi:hypothetical protein